jgi:hypothetical protein
MQALSGFAPIAPLVEPTAELGDAAIASGRAAEPRPFAVAAAFLLAFL